MQNITKELKPKDQLLMILGSILGGSIPLLLIKHLPREQVSIISALMLASLIILSAYLSNAIFRWIGIGAIAGMIIGLGGIIGGEMAESKTMLEEKYRFTFVVCQSMAGFISGVLLGRKVRPTHLPTLKEFLSNLSGLTVGMFAVLVTIAYIFEGLEAARSLSSRLSTSTTILITLLAIPGTVGYLLAEQWRKSGDINN